MTLTYPILIKIPLHDSESRQRKICMFGGCSWTPFLIRCSPNFLLLIRTRGKKGQDSFYVLQCASEDAKSHWLHFFLLLSSVSFHMGPQRTWVSACKVALDAFVGLFSTVCLQMAPQRACVNGCIITQVAFVWHFSTVLFQMCLQIVCPLRSIITLVAFVRLFSAVSFHMDPQRTWVSACKVVRVAYVWFFSTVCFQMCPQWPARLDA